MCSYKTNKNMSYSKLYNNHKTILITLNIKNIMLIAHVICCRKIFFDVRQISPYCAFCNVIPLFKRIPGITMTS